MEHKSLMYQTLFKKLTPIAETVGEIGNDEARKILRKAKFELEIMELTEDNMTRQAAYETFQRYSTQLENIMKTNCYRQAA